MEPMIHSSSSIPELIKFIKYSFRECEFDEVQSILVEREKSVKIEMENLVRDRDELKKQVEFLEKSKGYTELEKCDLEEKLKRAQKRGVELDKMKKKYEKLQSERLDYEEKLGRSERRCEELEKMIVKMKENLEKLRRENLDFEEKLGRSERRREELDEMNEKFHKLRSEKTDVEEKLVRSSEILGEMDERMVKMGKEIEELRREKLSASKTIEELKAKEVEADGVVQELMRKNANALQTIEELRVEKMKSDKAVRFYENDLDPRTSKLERALAKMLSVNVEDLASLAKGDGFAAEAEVDEILQNGKANLEEEDRAIVLREAPAVAGSRASVMQSGGEVPTLKIVPVPPSPAARNVVIVIDDSDTGSHARVMQSGGKVPTQKTVPVPVPSSPAAGNVVIVTDDSNKNGETSIPGTSSGQRNKEDSTNSREDSLMNPSKRKKLSTSATPSRCSSLPSRVEERVDALQQPRTVYYVDSTDSDDEFISDDHIKNLVATCQSKVGSKKVEKRQRLVDDGDYDSDALLIQLIDQKQQKESAKKTPPTVDRLLFRRTPEFFVDLVKGLNDKQVAAVQEMGFRSLVHFGLTDVPGRMAYWLLLNFEPITCSIKLKNSQRLHITEEDVHLTLGFPRGEMMIERKTRQKSFNLLDEISVGTNKGRYKMLPSYVQQHMENDKEGGDSFKKLFLILMEHALIEGTADGYVKPKILDFIENVSNVKKYNWCAYLLSILVKSHANWKDKPSTVFTGPIAFLVAFYVDRVVHCRRTVPRCYPTVKGWTGEMLKKRQVEELKCGQFGKGYVEPRLDERTLPVVSGVSEVDDIGKNVSDKGLL